MATLWLINLESRGKDQLCRFRELFGQGHQLQSIGSSLYLLEDCSEMHHQCCEFLKGLKGGRRNEGQRLEWGQFICLGREIELNINILIKHEQSLQMRQMNGGRLSELVNIISQQLAGKCETVLPIFNIGNQVQLRFRLSFATSLQLAHFIKESYPSFLWKALTSTRERDLNEFWIEAEQLKDLELLIDGLKIKQQKYSPPMPALTTILQGSFTNYDVSLQEMNRMFETEDLMAMKSAWDCGLPSLLHFIHQNWKVFDNEEELSAFILHNMVRAYQLANPESFDGNPQQLLDVYETTYPGINYFIDKFRALLGIDAIKKQKQQRSKNQYAPKGKTVNPVTQSKLQAVMNKLSIQEKVTDRLFRFFLDQRRMQAGHKTSIEISILNRETIKLKETIGLCFEFYRGMSRWTDLFSTISHYYKNLKKNSLKNDVPTFFEEIEQEELPTFQCLGCSKFYYWRQNIYDESVNKSLVMVFPSIRRLREDEAKVKDTICGMLNSGGGIILFDCEWAYRYVLTHGQKISPKQKQEYEQRIQSYIKSFYPKIDLNSQVSITFVPLVNPEENNQIRQAYTGKASYLKQNYSFKKHRYIDGMFVTRIKVVSFDPSLVYFWQVGPTLENKDIQYRQICQVISQKGVISQLKSKEMLKLIKQKMKRFYIPDTYDEQTKRLLKNPSTFLNHECDPPDIGTVGPAKGQIKSNPQPQKRQYMASEQRYNQMCLIVTKRKNILKTKEFLNKNGFPCEVNFHFESYHFAKAKNSAVIYHNNKFQDIFQQIKRPGYMVNNKSPLLINVTSYLILEMRNYKHRFSEEDFKRISKTFCNEFSNEFIRAYLFINDKEEEEYYLMTKSKLSTIFMYFYLDHCNEPAKLKSPARLDKLNEEERGAKFKLIFSSDKADQHRIVPTAKNSIDKNKNIPTKH